MNAISEDHRKSNPMSSHGKNRKNFVDRVNPFLFYKARSILPAQRIDEELSLTNSKIKPVPRTERIFHRKGECFDLLDPMERFVRNDPKTFFFFLNMNHGLSYI